MSILGRGRFRRHQVLFRHCPACLVALMALLATSCASPGPEEPPGEERTVDNHATLEEPVILPEPDQEGEQPLETALSQRQSARNFEPRALDLEQTAQLLWSGQGMVADSITGATRTAPSAGATHPLETYLVTAETAELPAGVYRYHPEDHALTQIATGDRRQELAEAALDQAFIAQAPATVVLGVHYEQITGAYGERGKRYAKMEAGHAGQNVCLQARALDLESVVVGAFCDEAVPEVLGIEAEPLSLISLGYPE